MLVCHCRAVTDRTIRETVRAGACSVEAVGDHCGAGTGCGGCHELVECIVADELGTEARSLVQLRRAEQTQTQTFEATPAASR